MDLKKANVDLGESFDRCPEGIGEQLSTQTQAQIGDFLSYRMVEIDFLVDRVGILVSAIDML
jgi:hypothetical protein